MAKANRFQRTQKRGKTSDDVSIPALIRTEAEIIAELTTLTQTPGFIHSFAYLAFKSNIVTAGEQFTKEDFLKIYDRTSLLRTESNLLLALLLSSPVSLDVPTDHANAVHISRTLALLEELHQAVLKPGHAVFREALQAHFSADGNETDPLRSGEIMREAFFYGSESAFTFQYLELAKKRYANDADWLRQNVGFTIEDAVAVMSAIRDSLTERLPKVFDEIRLREKCEWTFLPLFEIDVDDVISRCGLNRAIFDLVITKFLSTESTHFEIKNISQFNPVNARPLIRLANGRIYSFLEYSLCECVYEGPFYWICEDKKYLGAHSQSRGSFLEAVIDDLLSSIFGNNNVHRNVVFKNSKQTRMEADVLLIHGD